MSDKIREAFEAWHRSKFATKYCTGQPTRDMHNGVYAEKYGPAHEQQMWEAWQAALDQQPAAAAQALGTVCGGDAEHNTVIVHVDGQVPQLLWTIGTSVALSAPSAPAPAPAAQEPVAHVSQESYSSNGTSDIITRNLPIGTALYAAPPAAEQPTWKCSSCSVEQPTDRPCDVCGGSTAAEQPDTVKVSRELLEVIARKLDRGSLDASGECANQLYALLGREGEA